MRDFTRLMAARGHVLVLAVLLMLGGLGLPGTAAGWQEHEVAIPVVATGTVSLDLSDYQVFHFSLSPGECVRATLECSSTFPWGALSAWTDDKLLFGPAASTPSPTVQQVTFVASLDTTSYEVDVGPGIGTAFTLAIERTRPRRIALAGVRVPPRIRPRQRFNVSTRVWPEYEGFSGHGGPVRFIIQKRERGRWRGFSSAESYMPEFPATPGSMLVRGYRLRLPRGAYRIRARLIDAGHRSELHGAWRSFVVY